MANQIGLAGSDTLVLNGNLFQGLADGNVVDITFPNNIANMKTGKNGNTIYAYNAQGANAEMKLRLLRGSQDDITMSNIIIQQNANFSNTIPISGTFVKKIGVQGGTLTADTYILSGGIMTKNVPGKSNVDGDVEQAVSEYTIMFASAVRVLA